MEYERLGKSKRVIKARELWYAILNAQIETGTPYMLYKDACNSKSNQQNLGTIKCSNLCTEILEYTSKDEIAVCNLASVVLPKFVTADRNESDISSRYTQEFLVNKTIGDAPIVMYFDHYRLYQVVKVMVRNLNKIIEINSYPVKEAQQSNLRHRPVGVGVQGLADVFQLLRMPFDCDNAKLLNTQIFETIYYAAVDASNELACSLGTYQSYPGSPSSKGLLQFDLWNVTPSTRWDWVGLKARVATHGLRNSLLVAPMPTASTAQILGNNECFEPYTRFVNTP
jgi:ribonucleoside-diphosphate reductase alpha chain